MESLYSHFETFGGAIILSMIAFSVVFIILGGLCLMMMGLKHFVANLEEKINSKKSKTTKPSIPTVNVSNVSPAKSEGEDTIAAITAAIAACLGKSPAAFRLASVRRVAPSCFDGWKIAGRLEGIALFDDEHGSSKSSRKKTIL